MRDVHEGVTDEDTGLHPSVHPRCIFKTFFKTSLFHRCMMIDRGVFMEEEKKEEREREKGWEKRSEKQEEQEE